MMQRPACSLAASPVRSCSPRWRPPRLPPPRSRSSASPFEDVVRYLASPDPKLRVEAMRTLAQTAHPDAIGPIAQLTADPVDDIQLEALDTLLRFYLIDVPIGTKRVAVVFETGRKDPAEAAFAIGPYQLLPQTGARRA